VQGFLLDFLKFLILDRFYLACIRLLPLILSLALSLPVRYLLIEFIVYGGVDELAHIDLDKTIGSAVWQVINTSVVVSTNS
jgi:hypothetical protein